MPSPDTPPPRGRADARRNREKLIAAATRAFASGEERIPLEAIANQAGVGIGTLYRHFPTREALVEAVYHDQVARLEDGARELLAIHPPFRALRMWMDLFADWAATKHGMIDTLREIASARGIDWGQMRAELVAILRTFLDSGAAAGDLRSDVDAADVGGTLAGILTVAGAPEQRGQMSRMFDLLMDGLRPSTAS
jgi:AcrR family transcriptional regulator